MLPEVVRLSRALSSAGVSIHRACHFDWLPLSESFAAGQLQQGLQHPPDPVCLHRDGVSAALGACPAALCASLDSAVGLVYTLTPVFATSRRTPLVDRRMREYLGPPLGIRSRCE